MHESSLIVTASLNSSLQCWSPELVVSDCHDKSELMVFVLRIAKHVLRLVVDSC